MTRFNTVKQILVSNIDFMEYLTKEEFKVQKGKICCPFHDEKTPSLKVDKDTATFKCFGCGAYGTIVDFIRRYSQIKDGYQLSEENFLRQLCYRYNVKFVEDEDPFEDIIKMPVGVRKKPKYDKELSVFKAKEVALTEDEVIKKLINMQIEGFKIDDLEYDSLEDLMKW